MGYVLEIVSNLQLLGVIHRSLKTRRAKNVKIIWEV